MAIVGNASVLVNAITSNFGSQIAKEFSGLDRIAGASARDMSRAFNREIQKLNADRPLGRIADSLKELAPEADRTYKSFIRLVRVSYGLQAGIGAITGSIGAVLSGIVAIGASAAGAIPSVVALGGALGALLVGIRVGAGAFKGIGGALQQLQRGGGGGGGGADNTQAIQDALRNLARTIENNQRRIVDANNRIREAQLRLNDAFAEGREEIQQLGFEAEDAALAERRAAVELEKAREELARVQDLPPNSRIRRQAELAFQQADLDYRQAKDRATDLAVEQDRLAQTGVEGTQTVIEARQELAEAEENLRDVVLDSLRDQEDAQRRLDEARRGAGGGGGGAGIDPFKGLTESQKRFVLFLNNEVIPTFFSLKEAAADGFLPVLEEQIRRFYQAGAFERLRLGIASVSAALAESVTAFMDVFLMESNLENFSKFFEDSARILPQFGKVFGNSLRIVLTLLAAAAPITERFVNWVDKATSSYAAFLDEGQRTGELTAYFEESADLMARWGGVFGDVFGSIGDIIAANVGPGSGGDILLTWLEGAFNNLNNLDSTFLDIYFTNVGKNFTEILDAFNIIVDAMLEAGGNPAVGEFWRILQAGGGILQQVVRDSVNAAPLLAKVINSLFQIIAVFADAGPLNAFLETLGFLAAGASALVQALRPLLLVLGPIFAVASAFGLAFSIVNKVLTVSIGFIRNLIAPLTALSGALLGQTTSAQALAAAQANLLRSELALEVVRKRAALDRAAATVAQLQGTIAAGTATVATQAQAIAQGQLAVATGAYEVAIQKAGVASVTAGTLMKVALGPVGWIIAGLTAVAAGLFAVMAINQQNMDKAVEATTESIKNNADAAVQWDNALLAVANGSSKTILGSLDGLKEGLDAVSATAPMFANQTSAVNSLSISTKRALESFGKSLSNVATTNLGQAQQAFSDLARSQNLTRSETRQALAQMPEYRAELLAQADAMGIQLRNSDGVVDSTLQLEFAMGEGAIAVRNQTAALAEQNKELVDAAVQSANLFEVAKVGTAEGEVTFDQFLKNTKEKAEFTVMEIAATQELAQSGLSASAIAMLRESGLTAQELLAEVTNKGSDFVNSSNLDSLKISGTYSKAIESIGGDSLSVIEQAAKYALDTGVITFDEFIAVTGAKIDGYNPTVVIEEDSSAFTDIERRLRSLIPTGLNVPVTLSPRSSGQFRFIAQAVKNGGIIEPLRFANGGMWAGSGSVTGAGGPRDDRVPALLSAGEYVVNALATKRYKPLLEAINGGSPTFANRTATQGGMDNTNVTIVVNPSAGMDERELAKMVSRQLATQLRRGTVS